MSDTTKDRKYEPAKRAEILYGPNNPHPSSLRRTELVWEGKYDEYGNRREIDFSGAAMPLQLIETVDEPRARAESQGDMFNSERAHVDSFRNMLIWGENKLVTASLRERFGGKIDLIYIDPPFDVGADFTLKVPIGEDNETTLKDQSALEMVAFRDMWGRQTDSYLHMMYERLVLMRDLLSERGSIFVHADWHMGAYLRLLLDDIFGSDNFRNEIIWYYYNKMHDLRKPIFPRSHDIILFYVKAKGARPHFEQQRIQREKPVRQLVRKKVDGKMVNARDDEGNVMYRTASDKAMDDVWRISMLQPADKTQNTGYATQKPEEILERIISATTQPGDLVADFYCGSGTTGAVAERLGRRWIMSEFGRFGVHTTRKRLIELQRAQNEQGRPYRCFDVYNLGRYERQWWQKQSLEAADEDHRRVVLEFYRAEILAMPPSPLIHGRKGAALCHVDGIDGLLTRGEVVAFVRAVIEAGGKQATCLAWEFEMDLRLACNSLEKEHNLKITLIQIPREIMEKNRTEPPPFLEVASLEAEPVYRLKEDQRVVDIKLTNFLPSLAEVPTKELEALQERATESGFDFIDFWAVDFNFRNGGPFNHHWQDYRTRKDRSLKTVSEQSFIYDRPGQYNACVKVVDIFGCDTSITVPIDYE